MSTREEFIATKGTCELNLKVHRDEHKVEELLKEELRHLSINKESHLGPREDNNKRQED